MDSYSSFDRMVVSLTPAERAAMLEKVQAIVNPESQSLASAEMKGPKVVPDIELQLKGESFLTRILLRIKSIFTNTDIKTLYNAHILMRKGHEIERKEPGLIDMNKRIFQKVFYDQMEQLSKCAGFFRNGIEIYDADQGGFYVFLSSLIAPEVNGKIDEEINPQKLPFDREVTSELRLSMVRNLESTVQSMPSINRAALYSAVCNTEWIRQFVHLPFDRVLSSFTEMKKDGIPVTLILVVIFYLGGELWDAIFVRDNISQLTHIQTLIQGILTDLIGLCVLSLHKTLQELKVKEVGLEHIQLQGQLYHVIILVLYLIDKVIVVFSGVVTEKEVTPLPGLFHGGLHLEGPGLPQIGICRESFNHFPGKVFLLSIPIFEIDTMLIAVIQTHTGTDENVSHTYGQRLKNCCHR